MVKFLVILVSILTIAISLFACNDAAQDRQPVEIISVSDAWPPVPAGPTIEISLKNTSDETVIQLKGVIELEKSYDIDFAVDDLNPLMPGATITEKQTLIGPGSGISTDETYSLKVSGTFQSGEAFNYTKKVRIGSSFEF